MEFLNRNKLLLHLCVGAALAAVYPMQTIFSGNQNVYFLWGAAKLLPGSFAADPLLASPDPYPLFSALISLFPAQYLGLWTTLIYLLLNVIYSFSFFGIANHVAPIYRKSTLFFSFSALFLFLHSAPIWGTYVQLVFDMDLRWIWDSGIAEQGILRGYLQPSVFGVFLLLSIYLNVQKKHTLAILCIAPAAAFHASYLFLGGSLAALFLFQSNFGKKNVFASALLLALTLPYAYYILQHFVVIDQELSEAINAAVVAGYEQNIHINPSNWLSAKFYLQWIIVILGTVLLWKSQLRYLVLGLLLWGILWTVIAYGLPHITLISLNPWRISVIVVPIATSIVLVKTIHSGVWRVIRHHAFSFLCIMAIALLCFRIFGSISDDFMQSWKRYQIAAFLIVLVAAGFIFKHPIRSKALPFVLMLLLIGVGITDHYIYNITQANTHQFQVIKAIDKRPEPNTIYIIPPHWTSFRMNAQKAVYADNNLVYGPALPALNNRLQLLQNTTLTHNYNRILETIPTHISVKVITEKPSLFPQNAARITTTYSSVTLR